MNPLQPEDLYDLVREVIEYCEQPENYENGWDIIVCQYSETQISQELGDATTLEEAIKNLQHIVDESCNSW